MSWPGTATPFRAACRSRSSTRSWPFNETLRAPKVREALEKQGLQTVDPMTASQLAALYAADTEKYAKVIGEAKIKLTN